MIINANSWHCRFHDLFWNNRPKSLCPYFWRIVLTIFLFIVGGIGALCVCLGAGITVVDIAGYMDYLNSYSIYTSAPIAIIIGAVSIAILSSIIVFANKISKRISQWKYERDYKKYLHGLEELKEPKQPGLLKSFIKAHKEKFCPTLEFKD